MAAQLSVEMTGDERKLAKKLVRAEASIDSLKRKLRDAGKTGQRSGTQITGSMKGIQTAMVALAGAAGLASIQQALSTINQSYQTWLQNTRAISSEARKAANELIAFAALQEGGTKAQRVNRAATLASRFGVLDRGEAFNTVQALQSARSGDFEAGISAARTVFASTQVGIPLDRARELEVLGAAQGLDPGQAVRMAFVAGQESSRDPRTLAGAAPGLSFYEDKLFGISAAGVLAGSVKEEELGTFVKAAGIALSKTSAVGFQETFENLGVADASRMERLQALADAGINTQEALGLAGLGELRQQQALVALVNNLPEVHRIMNSVKEKATSGLFASQRSRVEQEIPSTRFEREIQILQALGSDEAAFGDRSIGSLQVEREDRIRGLALRRLGLEEMGPIDLIDEEGRSSVAATFILGLNDALSRIQGGGGFGEGSPSVVSQLSDTMEQIRRELEDIKKNTLDTANNVRSASERRPRINPDAQNE